MVAVVSASVDMMEWWPVTFAVGLKIQVIVSKMDTLFYLEEEISLLELLVHVSSAEH